MRISDWSSDVCSADLFPGRSRWQYRTAQGVGPRHRPTATAPASRSCCAEPREGSATARVTSTSAGQRPTAPATASSNSKPTTSIGRAAWRGRVWKDGENSGDGGLLKKKKNKKK